MTTTKSHREPTINDVTLKQEFYLHLHTCHGQIRQLKLLSGVMKTSAMKRRPSTTDVFELFYWSTSTTDVFNWSTSIRLSFSYWSMSTRLSFSTGRRWMSTVDAVDGHFTDVFITPIQSLYLEILT